jgi:CRISPR-associated protein Csm3
MPATRLLRVHKITGTLTVLTGLRVGGSQEAMEISGLDNPIVRNPANAEPYIPGSSLKGRMRSLAEWYFGELPESGDVTKPRIGARTARAFGLPARSVGAQASESERKAYTRGPTRLIVRDAHLAARWREEFRKGRPLTEVKSENSINRLTAMANPRPMERVLPGVQFDVELLYRAFDVDGDQGAEDEQLLRDVVLVALKLVESDALGGGSSRGNGKFRFENLQLDGAPLDLPALTFAATA